MQAVNDYEEDNAAYGTRSIGNITAHLTGKDMGLEDTPPQYSKLTFFVMTPHCHAPDCIREELWNAGARWFPRPLLRLPVSPLIAAVSHRYPLIHLAVCSWSLPLPRARLHQRRARERPRRTGPAHDARAPHPRVPTEARQIAGSAVLYPVRHGVGPFTADV